VGCLSAYAESENRTIFSSDLGEVILQSTMWNREKPYAAQFLVAEGFHALQTFHFAMLLYPLCRTQPFPHQGDAMRAQSNLQSLVWAQRAQGR
jgi:hypothetical protein